MKMQVIGFDNDELKHEVHEDQTEAITIPDRVCECIAGSAAANVGSIQRYIKKQTGKPCGEGAVLFHLKNLLAEGRVVLDLRRW